MTMGAPLDPTDRLTRCLPLSPTTKKTEHMPKLVDRHQFFGDSYDFVHLVGKRAVLGQLVDSLVDPPPSLSV